MALETKPLPFANPVFRNADATSVRENISYLRDGFVTPLPDGSRVVRRRAGLDRILQVTFAENLPLTDLYWWDEKQCLVMFVSSGPPVRVNYDGTVFTQKILANGPEGANSRRSFASDGNYLFMAKGGKITYTDGGSGGGTISDGDAPTQVTDIAILDGYLLANSAGTNQWYWAELDDPFTWSALDFASAASNPDFIQSLKVWNRQIYLFGAKTTEVWSNNPETGDFQRNSGGALEVGCGAPNSSVVTDKGVYWLDEKRHVRFHNGGQAETLSTPYDEDFAAMRSVADCYSFVVEFNGHPFLLFVFPTDSRSLAMDLNTGEWAEWGYWNIGYEDYGAWIGACYTYSPAWNLNLVGDRLDGNLYKMDLAYHADYTIPIRTSIVTGHVSRDNLKMKRCCEVRIAAKRGAVETSDGAAGTLMLRWKDNNRQWSNEFPFSLGRLGETDLVMRKQACGMYRTRQWEVSCTDAVPFNISSAEEDFEVLR